MSKRYEIEFTEGGVGVFETLVTAGIAPIIEKTLDAITGDDSHGWYCTITDKITGLKEIQWGVNKAEAQEKTFQALIQKIENYENEQIEYQQQIQREREEAEYQLRVKRQAQKSSYQTVADDDDETSWMAELLGYALIIAAILWFFIAVAIPLFLINIATIALIAGLIKKNWSKYLFSFSILGSIIIVFDYNYGWVTEGLVVNVPFFKKYIPAIFYTNIIAGLIAAYFFVRNLLNDKYGTSSNEFSRRNLIVMACLLVVGGLTIGLQKYFDSKYSNGIQLTETTSPNSLLNTGETGAVITGYIQTKEGSSLRLRSEPSVESTILASMPNGSTVIILREDVHLDEINGEKGKWVKVKYNENEGWAWSGFIIEDSDSFTGNWKGDRMIFIITKAVGKYKIKVTNEGREGSPTNNLICTLKDGKIFYPGRPGDYYKFQIPTIELLTNGNLMYRDGAIDVELTKVK